MAVAAIRSERIIFFMRDVTQPSSFWTAEQMPYSTGLSTRHNRHMMAMVVEVMVMVDDDNIRVCGRDCHAQGGHGQNG